MPGDASNSVDIDGNADANGLVSGPGSPMVDPPTPVDTTAATAVAPTAMASANGPPKAVSDVMYSDIGITTLLNRLKQSIASARDFAAFLQKRSKLEEHSATGLKALAKTHLDSIRRSEARGGTFAAQLAEVYRVHERMAENGMQFALSLHQMHEDLGELSSAMEKGRKQWKHEGYDAEKRAFDAEAAMHKAKARYDSLAEDYDRARTGDTKGSRRIGLKGPKSAEQHESDLLRKVQASDAEYEERVRLAKAQRESLVHEQRPRAVQALKELCRECDSGLTLQLQKFATFNEKLLLGNGLAVTPLTGDNTSNAQKSLRDVIFEIDNDGDFHQYIAAHASKIPARSSVIRYEKHPTLLPKTQQPTMGRSASGGAPQLPQPDLGPAQQQPRQPSLSVNTTSASQPGSMNGRYSSLPAPGPLVAASQAEAYNQTSPIQGSRQQAATSGDYGSQLWNSQPPDLSLRGDRTTYGTPPYPTEPAGDQLRAGGSVYPPQHGSGYPPPRESAGSGYPPPREMGGSGYPIPREMGSSGYPSHQTTGTLPSQQARTQYTLPPIQPSNPLSPTRLPFSPMTPAHPQPGNANNHPTSLPPLRPVFGLTLSDLFARDHSAVPMLVIQCILAVDHFGLEVEGIYRLSGTSSHVTQLRDAFNHDATSVDFRNPANFLHDVNSVATLLKQFFREMPDPLFTHAGYRSFIDAARVEDEAGRRDALHQSINDLPDPNYATLRALVLHLHRVMMNESRNRMGASNLALCFAPSLMGTHTGAQIADATLQARVLDTILVNATAIFDED